MEGEAPTVSNLDNQDLSYKNDKWTGRTPAGAAAIYSADLIEVVELCVRYDVEDRPSAQEALVLIEQYMPTYADSMDRWGTLSWVKAQHANAKEAKDGNDAEDADDGDTTAGSTTTGSKRNSTAPLPPPKRLRFIGALQQRLQLVAAQMKGAKPRVNKADQEFILADRHKIILSDDKSFNSCEFFECADPKHIEFRDITNTAALATAFIDPVILPTRATSAPPIPSGAITVRVYYFTAGDVFTLLTTQARYQAAFDYRYSITPNPTTISSMDWSLARTRFLYHERRATNLHERMYWLSRSVQAEYYARGDYVNGRGSDFYIGLAVLNWSTHLGG
jgi:hypothetical protein